MASKSSGLEYDHCDNISVSVDERLVVRVEGISEQNQQMMQCQQEDGTDDRWMASWWAHHQDPPKLFKSRLFYKLPGNMLAQDNPDKHERFIERTEL